jgi:hypothetical protein
MLYASENVAHFTPLDILSSEISARYAFIQTSITRWWNDPSAEVKDLDPVQVLRRCLYYTRYNSGDMYDAQCTAEVVGGVPNSAMFCGMLAIRAQNSSPGVLTPGSTVR